MIVRVIGDVHGKMGGYFDVLDDLVENNREDVRSVQIGDMGFGENYRQRSRRMSRGNKYEGDHHVFFGGNHDDYDQYADANGSLGDFGIIPFVPNSFFVRGAYSIDRDQRTIGHDWWDDEELGWKKSKQAIDRYIEVKPDVMFTHDAPEKIVEDMFPNRQNVSTHTGKMLNEMLEAHRPKKWFFGHWHKDVSMTADGTEFICLGELSYTDLKLEEQSWT